MSPEIHELIHRVRSAYGDACFACGPSNPIGMRLELVEVADGEVEAAFVPRNDYRGAHDTLHGGIAATALDEILVWAGILTEGVMSVTGTLDLKFRRPITVRDRVTARGRVDDRRGRRMVMSGALEVDGSVAVEGKGVYLVTVGVEDL